MKLLVSDFTRLLPVSELDRLFLSLKISCLDVSGSRNAGGGSNSADGDNSAVVRRDANDAVIAGWQPDVLLCTLPADAALADAAFSDVRAMMGRFPRLNVILAAENDAYMARAIRLHASGYIMLPLTESKIREEFSNLLYPADDARHRIFVKTFGNFDIFVDGKPLHFKRSKAKETLALLIDRGGSTMTTRELASYLYEDRFYDRSLKNTMMPILYSLKETLSDAGADILVSAWGTLAVNPDRFVCDLYEYLKKGNPSPPVFTGEYMTNYSWGEGRAAELYWARENNHHST